MVVVQILPFFGRPWGRLVGWSVVARAEAPEVVAR